MFCIVLGSLTLFNRKFAVLITLLCLQNVQTAGTLSFTLGFVKSAFSRFETLNMCYDGKTSIITTSLKGN